MRVATAYELGAAPLNPPIGLADGQIHRAKHAPGTEWQFLAGTADHQLAGVTVADRLLDPSRHVAPRRQHVQEREPGMVDGPGGLDELFGPGYRLVVVDPKAEECRVRGDGGGGVEV